MSKNSFVMGTLLGLFFPMVAFALIYIFWFYDTMAPGDYLNYLWIRSTTFAGVISISLIINLPVFYFNIWSHRYETARGVIFSTMLCGGFIIYLKLIR
ncbi:MAG: hypothetical protein ACK5AS_04430 [Bacteroidota bacterium]|jgi:hypothetical protein